ncbi:rust resistance kinase Lr10-like isoform X2 [Salvia hispanica]|uniref:rust resistance kinase Lr10-like isoform X2 n=1 Tax=Salvia hispanica TaxID=49212 RepID=UPI00200906AD|nr:rust resistance kinase Lr10-like isoform X2 [Salvia hispanica]
MKVSEVPYTCRLDLKAMTSLDFKDLNNVSLSQIHESLLYGFELTFCHSSCGGGGPPKILGILWYLIIPFAILGMLCAFVSPPVFAILGFATVSLLSYDIVDPEIHQMNYQYSSSFVTHLMTELIIVLPRVIIFLFVSWFLIYKFRRRHLSEYSIIESYLQSDNKLLPIRYSYSDIKRMTRGFQEKLGEGGYGCVYKGKFRSGHDVAIKMLGNAGGSGSDFMNEIATIGRIHHVNVVKLVGYVVEDSKRGLIFDFMPNGSLDKYLLNQERMSSLNWATKFDIAVGIARGLEYLHRGCGIQILHFDIKPHNILLDHNFIPKISDFGLAKLCSVEKETVTLIAARGTIGYVAPELINRGIGRVSSKADVYSFGMLLIEMVGLNRELRGNNDDSTKYFPYWIYDHINQGEEIEIEKVEQNNNTDENEVIRKMTIVALWCIQMSPDNRPSMNQVLGMLESDVEQLQIPKIPPSQPNQITGNKEESWLTDATDSASLLHHNNSSNFEITFA